MPEETLHVLLIEDNPSEAQWIVQMLRGPDRPSFELEYAEDLQAGLDKLSSRSFDAILLGLGLPDRSDLDAVSEAIAAAPDVPIIVRDALSPARPGTEARRSEPCEY